MKSKKVVIISSLILFIVGFLLLVLGYWFNKMCLNPLMVELIKNLGFGVFCSSAVTFGISGPEYYIAKKKSLEKYLAETNKLLSSFLKIEYFQYETYEKELIDYFYYKEINKTFPSKNFVEKESENLNKLKNCHKKFSYIIDDENLFNEVLYDEYKNVIRKLNKVIRSYTKFANDVSIYELDSCYSEFSFFRKKYEVWIFKNLQITLHTYFNLINNMIKSLNDLTKTYKIAYYRNVAILIDELQKRLYEVDTENKLNITAPRGYSIDKIILRKYTNELEKNIEILRSKIYNDDVNEINPRYYLITSLSTENE